MQHDLQRVVAVASVVSQQQRRAGACGYDEVRIAVMIHIGSDDRTRVRRGDLIQLHLRRHVLEAGRACVAEHSYLRPPRRLHDHREVNPPIVVDVDRRDTPGANDVMKRQKHPLEPSSIDVLPQRDRWRRRMGHGNVHPAILVEIKGGQPHCRCEILLRKQRRRQKSSFPRIHIKGDTIFLARYGDIDGPVIVQVREHRCPRAASSPQPGRLGPLGERLIAVVPPQHVRATRPSAVAPRTGDEQIEIAIMVVVDKGQACRVVELPDSNLLRNVGKRAIATIAIKQHAVAHGNRQVGMAVVIEVAHRTNHRAPAGNEPATLRRTSFKASLREMMVVADRTASLVQHNQIGPAMPLEIEQTHSSASFGSSAVGRRQRLCNGRQRHAGERQRNHGPCRWQCRPDLLGKRVDTLVPVGLRQRCGELIASDLLEAL